MRRAPTVTGSAAAGVLALATLGACGADGDIASLSPEAEAGRTISRTNGCSACHGSGPAGVGPDFAGLFGSQVTLDDGTVVVADEAYLREAIRVPGATRVAGYALSMPDNDLSDAQIASVIAYIRELSAAPEGQQTQSSPQGSES